METKERTRTPVSDTAEETNQAHAYEGYQTGVVGHRNKTARTRATRSEIGKRYTVEV